jgi:hypothetical protein
VRPAPNSPVSAPTGFSDFRRPAALIGGYVRTAWGEITSAITPRDSTTHTHSGQPPFTCLCSSGRKRSTSPYTHSTQSSPDAP